MAEAMWSTIRSSANEVERLIGQKKYNLAMIKSRQTLEIMVKDLVQRYDLPSAKTPTDLASQIDELYNAHVITRTTADHYHKIRMIGNKAAHEADDNPGGANTSYHLLAQELYTFANSSSSAKPRRQVRRKRRSKLRITPELIFNIAVSGSVQYQLGMQKSKCIVAVNQASDAPIFDIARYGIVEDYKKFIPALIEELKSRK